MKRLENAAIIFLVIFAAILVFNWYNRPECETHFLQGKQHGRNLRSILEQGESSAKETMSAMEKWWQGVVEGFEE